jgi:DNA primase
MAPIIFNGQLVSYQGRDVTGKQQAKYKACREEDEVLSHKHILYGWDKVPVGLKSCLVVEGVTGVWRFGYGSLGTFGVEYSSSQIRLLAERFEKIYLLFDEDEAGERATNNMTADLSAMGKDVVALEFYNENFNIDSGNFPQSLADSMMVQILKGEFLKSSLSFPKNIL